MLLGKRWEEKDPDTVRVEFFGPCIHDTQASYASACRFIRKAIQDRISLTASAVLAGGKLAPWCHPS